MAEKWLPRLQSINGIYFFPIESQISQLFFRLITKIRDVKRVQQRKTVNDSSLTEINIHFLGREIEKKRIMVESTRLQGEFTAGRSIRLIHQKCIWTYPHGETPSTELREHFSFGEVTGKFVKTL